MKPVIADRIIERLAEFTKELEKGELVEVTEVKREETPDSPDSPLHTFKKVKKRLGKKKK